MQTGDMLFLGLVVAVFFTFRVAGMGRRELEAEIGPRGTIRFASIVATT